MLDVLRFVTVMQASIRDGSRVKPKMFYFVYGDTAKDVG